VSSGSERAPARRPGRAGTPPPRPDEHLRCRSARHVWLDHTARARCCDPGWRKVLVGTREWETRDAAGIEYAGRSAVPRLDYGWQPVT
jgi:hypothetical protein